MTLSTIITVILVIGALVVASHYLSLWNVSSKNGNVPVAANANHNEVVEGFEGNNGGDVQGAEVKDNVMMANVEPSNNAQNAGGCFPRDSLTSADLLPKDAANSKWSQVTPSGQGALSDKNFLSSSYLFGDDTITNSLRNPSYDLRGAPPNPQNEVGPWSQSTIGPDLHRRPLE